MNAEQLYKKDFALKYTSQSSVENTKKQIEDLKISVGVSEEELRTARERLHMEKKIGQDLYGQVAMYKEKVNGLEKNVVVLNDLIRDKDLLIGKLWDELLKGKKTLSVEMREGDVLDMIGLENEISEEGRIGNIHMAVGRDCLTKPIPSKYGQHELNQENIFLRDQLSSSEKNCKEANERLKDINEKYVKCELEIQELKEKIRILNENALVTTQQIAKLSTENISQKNIFALENEVLLKKIQSTGENSQTTIKELEVEIESCREKLHRAGLDKKKLSEENQEIRKQNSELFSALESKKSEFHDFSMNSQCQLTELLSLKQLELEGLQKENFQIKKNISEMNEKKKASFQNSFQGLLAKSIKTHAISDLSEPDEILNKVQSVIVRYKSKVKKLKQEISQLTSDKFSSLEKIKELESRTASTQIFESPNKHFSVSEILLSTPTYSSQIEKYKSSLEKQKISKRRALAEKEQYKEDLAYSILTISDLQQKLFACKLEASDCDYISLLQCEASGLEELLSRSKIR